MEVVSTVLNDDRRRDDIIIGLSSSRITVADERSADCLRNVKAARSAQELGSITHIEYMREAKKAREAHI